MPRCDAVRGRVAVVALDTAISPVFYLASFSSSCWTGTDYKFRRFSVSLFALRTPSGLVVRMQTIKCVVVGDGAVGKVRFARLAVILSSLSRC